MVYLLAFISGALLGGIIGTAVMACMNAASKADADIEKITKRQGGINRFKKKRLVPSFFIS